MSLVIDSPVGIDDFVDYLDGLLDDDDGDGEAESEFASSSSSSASIEEESEDDYQPVSKRAKISEVEIVQNGDALEGSASHLIVEHKLEASSVSKNECTHRGDFHNLCIDCGVEFVADGPRIASISKEIRLGTAEVARLRDNDTKSVLCRRKLYLVLDLDHTLLNSTNLADMVPEEEYLNSQIDPIQDLQNGSLYRLNFRSLDRRQMHMMTKLRPYVRTFLKEASQMFEMYIYTMGDRAYAREMVKLLDPGKEYFNAKVISRDDGTHRHQKGLDVVPGDESAVLILDDTEKAIKTTLILMERYHFFASSCQHFEVKCKSLSQLKRDESEPEGALAAVLHFLKRVHNIFFNELAGQPGRRDVRQVLKTVRKDRKDILKGCKIVFSRVFPTEFPAESHELWKIAENLGATCSTKVEPSVTHVVAMDRDTQKSCWALENGKFLVLPRWLEAANYLWQRLPEENFPVPNQNQKEQQSNGRNGISIGQQ